MKDACPCGRDQLFQECCEMIHKDISKALTAEDLMRSRYSAFVKGDIEFLMESHHSSTRPLKQKSEIKSWAQSVQWLSLEILRTKDGQSHQIEGSVEFKAHFKEGKKKSMIHENSQFVRDSGNWVYLGYVK